MDFLKSLAIAASGLHAQIGRMEVISQTFSSELDRSLDAHVVKLGHVQNDGSDFTVKHEPGNPAADANGNVKYPNVNALVEMTDLRDAQRSYEANLNIITATRRMLQRTLDILKG